MYTLGRSMNISQDSFGEIKKRTDMLQSILQLEGVKELHKHAKQHIIGGGIPS